MSVGLLNGLEQFVGGRNGLHEIRPTVPRLSVDEEGGSTGITGLLQFLQPLVVAVLDKLFSLLVVVDALELGEVTSGNAGFGGEFFAQLLIGLTRALVLRLVAVDDVVVGLVLTYDVGGSSGHSGASGGVVMQIAIQEGEGVVFQLDLSLGR